MIPSLHCLDVSNLQQLTIGVEPRSKRQRVTVNYNEDGDDEPEDTPLVAKLVAKELPGLLLISNMCFVEDTKRLEETNAGMVIVATDSQGMGPIVAKLKRANKVVASIPFRDSIQENRKNILDALRQGVAAVHRFWDASGPKTTGNAALKHRLGNAMRLHPETGALDFGIDFGLSNDEQSAKEQEEEREEPPPILVHCSAGQNRSAAVALAIMLSYGVDVDEAVNTIKGSATKSEFPGKAWDRAGWEKFVGPSGKMLLEIVKENF
jgi:hypothetical protein